VRGTSRGIAHLLASVEDRSVSHAHVQIENLYENQICLSETEISLTIVISLLLKGPPFPDRAHCFHVPKALLPLWVSATSPVMSKQAWLVPVMMCGRTWWVGVFFIRYFPTGDDVWFVAASFWGSFQAWARALDFLLTMTQLSVPLWALVVCVPGWKSFPSVSQGVMHWQLLLWQEIPRKLNL
jgi:hypothetical protein